MSDRRMSDPLEASLLNRHAVSFHQDILNLRTWFEREYKDPHRPSSQAMANRMIEINLRRWFYKGVEEGLQE